MTKRLVWAAILVLVGLTTISESQAANLSWSGGGPNANWTTPDNWGFVGTPTNGDTLIFPAGQPNMLNTNNIVGLTLNQIRFVGTGGGYDIRGNSFTLTNHIEATNSSGANTIENNIVFSNVDQIVDVTVSSLTLSGALSGPVGLVKNGAGTLTLAGNVINSFGGDAFVNGGTLQLGKVGSTTTSTAIPNSLTLSNSTTVRLLQSWQLYSPFRSFALKTTLNPNSVFDFNGNDDWLAQVSLKGAQITSGTGLFYLSGDITVVSNQTVASFIHGNLQLYGYSTCTNNTITNTGHFISPDLIIRANISSHLTNTLIKAGSGEVDLAGTNNTYEGETIVNQGNLWVDYTNGLGNTNLPATVKAGGGLFLDFSAAIGLKPLVLNGDGYFGGGALSIGGVNSWAGDITLASDTSINAYFPGTSVALSGAIGGPGALAFSGSGTLTLSGATANTYGGTTHVISGTLQLGKTLFDSTIPNDLVIENTGTVKYLTDNQIPNLANVTVNGVLNLNGFVEGLGTINGFGVITFGAGLLDMYGSTDCIFWGVMSGSGAIGFSQRGPSTITLNGNNIYSGSTRVFSGKLVVNGSQPQSAVSVSGGILAGAGTVGAITANGVVSPGDGVGVLNCSNVTFSATGSLNVNLTGPFAGVGGYDQLNVQGSNTLANATLSIFPSFINPVPLGQTFVILNNDGVDPINGTFNGLPEGAGFTVGAFGFKITYAGGTGNDVVLTLTNVPVGQTGASISSGNGSGAIDPNECNYLSVTITNKTGTPMAGISATLSSATENIFVSQPFSAYPDAPSHGLSTNTTPFQLSASTNFVCGTPVNLTLTVSTPAYGNISIPVALSSGSPAVVPLRYDMSVATNIPDIGTIESTNIVSGFAGPLTKVGVSLWLTHPIDSDLTISLISPSGTNITLVAGTGAGANFGTACAPDASRTTFDDAAAISITAGSPPFAGTFRPQAALAGFNNASANGNWRLRVTDSVGGSLGTLRCWSLFLYPVSCPAGGGFCELCPNVVIAGAAGPASLTQSNYVNISGTASMCGAPHACPGTSPSITPYPCDDYTFRNGPSDACITVTVENDSQVAALLAAAYSGTYNPLSPDKCVNYLADCGNTIFFGTPQTFSFSVAANAVFVVNVISSTPAVIAPYKLTVTGGDCRPMLNINPVPGNKVKLDWTTAAADYLLETTNHIVVGATNWPAITNVPSVVNSRFVVTNNATGSQFYRLHKP